MREIFLYCNSVFCLSVGYKAKLRFEGNGMDSTLDFWIHLCTAECYPVNGAEKAGKQLKPPAGKYSRLSCAADFSVGDVFYLFNFTMLQSSAIHGLDFYKPKGTILCQYLNSYTFIYERKTYAL